MIPVGELEALCDLLIPGDGLYPPPSAIGLPARLAAHERFGPMASTVIGSLGLRVASLAPAEAIIAIAALEQAHPTEFRNLIVALYSLYYSDPAVLPAINEDFDYAARPPQPLGHTMDHFDPASVAVPASRGRQYRETGEDGNAAR